MSYNLDSVKVKKCDLTIKRADLEKVLAGIKKSSRYDVPFDVKTSPISGVCKSCGQGIPSAPGSWTLSASEGGGLEGSVNGDTLTITNVKCYGSGSGGGWTDIIEPILAKTKGVFEAVLVWEGGDSLYRLKVKDGKMTQEDL